MVIKNEELSRDFRYIMKQKGGMFAKGRLLGLRAAFDEKGYPYLVPNRTNQTHSAVRFCTSWATKEENVDALIQAIRAL